MSEAKTDSKENLYQDNSTDIISEGRSSESIEEKDVKTAEEIEETPPPPPPKATPPPRKDQEEADCEVAIEIE